MSPRDVPDPRISTAGVSTLHASTRNRRMVGNTNRRDVAETLITSSNVTGVIGRPPRPPPPALVSSSTPPSPTGKPPIPAVTPERRPSADKGNQNSMNRARASTGRASDVRASSRQSLSRSDGYQSLSKTPYTAAKLSQSLTGIEKDAEGRTAKPSAVPALRVGFQDTLPVWRGVGTPPPCTGSPTSPVAPPRSPHKGFSKARPASAAAGPGAAEPKKAVVRPPVRPVSASAEHLFRVDKEGIAAKLVQKGLDASGIKRVFDADRTGHISLHSFKRGLERLGMGHDMSQVGPLFKELDVHHNGRVQVQQLQRGLRQVHPMAPGARLTPQMPDARWSTVIAPPSPSTSPTRSDGKPRSQSCRGTRSTSSLTMKDDPEQFRERGAAIASRMVEKLDQKMLLHRAQNKFRYFDTDRDGVVTMEDLDRGLKEMNLAMVDADTTCLVHHIASEAGQQPEACAQGMEFSTFIQALPRQPTITKNQSMITRPAHATQPLPDKAGIVTPAKDGWCGPYKENPAEVPPAKLRWTGWHMHTTYGGPAGEDQGRTPYALVPASMNNMNARLHTDSAQATEAIGFPVKDKTLGVPV